MLTSHAVTLHHIITVYNDLLNLLNGVMQAWVNKKNKWTEALYFAKKFAIVKLSKYYTKVTAITGLPVISAHILHPFLKT
jgi:hypothetical protein